MEVVAGSFEVTKRRGSGRAGAETEDGEMVRPISLSGSAALHTRRRTRETEVLHFVRNLLTLET